MPLPYLENGQEITVSCAEGSIGKSVPRENKTTKLHETAYKEFRKQKTPVLMNIGFPRTGHPI